MADESVILLKIPQGKRDIVFKALKRIEGIEAEDLLYMDLPQEFQGKEGGERVKVARLKTGLSQVELAKAIGVTQQAISMMEHGKKHIGKGMAKRLTGALDVADYRVFL